MTRKNVVILGSTGTIGINALKVVRRYPSRFRVAGLTAFANAGLLKKQVEEFRPRFAAIGEKYFHRFKNGLSAKAVKIFKAEEDLSQIVSHESVDTVVIGMRGAAALKPFLAAAKSGKMIAPANKEALVIAGQILMATAKRHGAKIIPVDSEQSAIFQCLDGSNGNQIKKVHLTASGGALLNVPRSRFDRLTVRQILTHPRWKMGPKITVDSATLMNKGFEIIEAMHLFGLTIDQIDVLIHPEAIIHSMVEFHDGSILGQLGVTDMRLPIQYALTYPERWDTGLKQLDFTKLKALHFSSPDFKKFPSLKLAMAAGETGGTLPSVLNAADEIAVEAFLNKKVTLTQIERVVAKVVKAHKVKRSPRLEDILDADRWARDEARRFIK